MIDKLSGFNIFPRPVITGVSYLRGYIQLKKTRSTVNIQQDIISGKYFDQLFHHNYISDSMLSALRPDVSLSQMNNVRDFNTLQGLINKLNQSSNTKAEWGNYLKVIQEEIGLRQEIFQKRLQEESV